MKGYTDYRVTIWENLISAMSSCQMNLGIVGGKIYIEGPEAGGGSHFPSVVCYKIPLPLQNILKSQSQSLKKYFPFPVAHI